MTDNTEQLKKTIDGLIGLLDGLNGDIKSIRKERDRYAERVDVLGETVRDGINQMTKDSSTISELQYKLRSIRNVRRNDATGNTVHDVKYEVWICDMHMAGHILVDSDDDLQDIVAFAYGYAQQWYDADVKIADVSIRLAGRE